MFLLNTPRSSIGLDISTASLKAVELLDRGRRLELTAFSYTRLPEPYTLPSAFTTMPLEDWVRIISESLEEAQFSSDAVVASLPSGQIFTTTLSQPNMPDDQLNQAIEFAATRIVPADLNDMVIVWSKEGKNNPVIPITGTKERQVYKKPADLDAEDQSISVFVAAVPKSLISWYEQLISGLRLELSALEIPSFALRRLVKGNTKSTVLVCYLDELETTFHLIHKGQVKLSSIQDYGSRDCVSSLINVSHLSPDQAKNLITSADTDLSNLPSQAPVKIAFDPILQEAARICHEFQQPEGKDISQTILLGEGAKATNLRTLWARTTNHQATLANPWRGLSLAPQLDNYLKDQGPLFAQAVCLAQRQLVKTYHQD